MLERMDMVRGGVGFYGGFEAYSGDIFICGCACVE